MAIWPPKLGSLYRVPSELFSGLKSSLFLQGFAHNTIAQFRYISVGETGSETPTPKRGYGEYGANNENKHTTVNIVRKAMCV